MTRRLDVLFAALAIAVIALVVVRAATVAPPRPLRAATDAERKRFAAQIASQEDDWRAKAAVDFPGDAWSQRDAFHGQEQNAVRDMANGAGVPIEEVFRAVDEDLHRPHPLGNRSADAVPLKPRPIYD